ncbi:MAG TPA: hypothetical protein VFM54_04125 [Micromonosporaceae bacterium]|nr:hypothetical protein [Micromonosporaceae bacterium]
MWAVVGPALLAGAGAVAARAVVRALSRPAETPPAGGAVPAARSRPGTQSWSGHLSRPAGMSRPAGVPRPAATNRPGTQSWSGHLPEPGQLSRPRVAVALERTNFRGRTVTLAGGPALAVAAATTAAAGAGSRPAAAAALVAGLGAGAVGLYDDVVGSRPEQRAAKGFRGHLSALRAGRLTSGLVKVAGVGAAGLAASALLAAGEAGRAGRPGRVRAGVDLLLGAGVIAGLANLVNLFDLRPGRAAKVGLLVGAPLAAGPARGLVAGPVGATAALLGDDLDEKIMLGDCGANALGALLGVALVARTGTVGRAAALTGIVALTAASEKVSFTQVIERTPGLRELDALGRSTDRG